METKIPLLIIVSGPAATGKTTLAKKLGELRSLPVFCKDDIKESLFDSLGYESPQKVEALETATYDLLFLSARTLLKASKSLIIESDVTDDFNEARIQVLLRVFNFRILQIACRTDGNILTRRFEDRMPAQHPGHYEAYYLEQSAEFRESLHRGFGKTLDIESDLITVDTTVFGSIDYGRIVSKIDTLHGI